VPALTECCYRRGGRRYRLEVRYGAVDIWLCFRKTPETVEADTPAVIRLIQVATLTVTGDVRIFVRRKGSTARCTSQRQPG